VDPSHYLDLFVAESREHLGAASKLASSLAAADASEGALRELFRHLHSIKGMAASMGYTAMSALAHDAESLMERLRAGALAPGATHGVLERTLACLERMLEAAEQRSESVDDPERESLQERLRGGPAPAYDAGGHAAPSRRGPEAAAGCVRIAAIVRRDAAFPAVRAAIVLGRLAKLGRIVLTDPPMAALRMGRFDGRLLVTIVSEHSVRALGTKVAAIEEVATFTLGPAEAPAEPAPAESSRLSLRVRADRLDALLEDALELMTSLGRIGAGTAARGALEGAAQTARRLYDGLVDVRLVPFEVVARRLERGAQELARRLGKPVRLDVAGRDVRLDRGVLDGLADPLLQMIRNAIDHGIEPPEERRRRKKPEQGRIDVAIERRSARLIVSVRDDGRGLDPRAIKQEAVERGLVGPAQAARLTEREALQLITLPGFSTSATPNEVSGRGVGMDIVRSGVEALGGRLRIETRPGRGTRFEMTFPIGVALVPAYLVRAGGELFAVPLSALDRIAVLDDQNTEWRDGRRFLAEGEGTIAVTRLSDRLGLPRDPLPPAPMVLLGSSPFGPRGLEVDAVLDRREIVVHPLPEPLGAVPLYAGAACLPDGSIALLLDLPALWGDGRG
jgi:two-component system, chemotaxis family, sensor kinase CheA